MKKITQLSLEKSRSHYVKKQYVQKSNPELPTEKDSSHIGELIFQKYNFIHRLKTNSFDHRTKHHSNKKTATLPYSKVIVISQFPKLQPGNSADGKMFLFQNDRIKMKQRQNSVDFQSYSFVHHPARKFTDYKDSIKRIQMNTTYRGFNFTKNNLYGNHRYPQNEKTQSQKNQDNISKNSAKAVQRKRIIQYIIEKGFAKKMEESLIKTRKERKTNKNELVSVRNAKEIQLLKSTKRSVVFSQTQSLISENSFTLKKVEGKQHPIEPWQS